MKKAWIFYPLVVASVMTLLVTSGFALLMLASRCGGACDPYYSDYYDGHPAAKLLWVVPLALLLCATVISFWGRRTLALAAALPLSWTLVFFLLRVSDHGEGAGVLLPLSIVSIMAAVALIAVDRRHTS